MRSHNINSLILRLAFQALGASERRQRGSLSLYLTRFSLLPSKRINFYDCGNDLNLNSSETVWLPFCLFARGLFALQRFLERDSLILEARLLHCSLLFRCRSQTVARATKRPSSIAPLAGVYERRKITECPDVEIKREEVVNNNID